MENTPETPSLLTRLQNHIAWMAPHQKERAAGKLLIEARKEIASLKAGLRARDEWIEKLRKEKVTINAERQEARTLRADWVRLDNERQRLATENTKLREQVAALTGRVEGVP
jgi:FtsZ-binding cell division protein ZapB